MITREDLERLRAFVRMANTGKVEGQLLHSMKLEEGPWDETLLRLDATIRSAPQDAKPKASIGDIFAIQNDLQIKREKEDADRRARVAKVNYDAAKKAGMPDPEAFAIGVEAVRQEFTKGGN